MWTRTFGVALAGSVALSVACLAAADEAAVAEAIVRAAGVRAGLCVHLGVTDGELDAALWHRLLATGGTPGSFLVHGLAADEESAVKARQHIQSQGLYGRVSVERGTFDHLPYADNLVNLLVADDAVALLERGLSLREVLRVLAPNGVACVGQRQGLTAAALRARLEAAGWWGGTGFQPVEHGQDGRATPPTGVWAKVVKPRPAEMDDWPQANYDAGGNRASREALLGPPSRVRWIDGPLWPRLHDGPMAAVSAGGRLVYVMDEARSCVAGPARLAVIARDAYNGLLLWKRALPPDVRFNPLTLVATRDRVYASIEPGGALAALDAATGEVLATYKDLPAPDWVVYHEGNLLASAGGELRCVEAATGRLRWANRERLVPASRTVGGLDFPNVVVDGDRLVYFAARRPFALGALDLATGADRWRKDITEALSDVRAGVALCSHHQGVLIVGEMYAGKAIHAFSAADGRHLWSHPYQPITHGGRHTEGFFVDGLYWTHVGGEPPYVWEGLAPLSGEVKRRIRYPDDSKVTHRCHMDKATARFFIGGSMDFVDVGTGEYTGPRLARSACNVGVVPANGLLYTFSHPCVCYPSLRGVMGLAAGPEGQSDGEPDGTPVLEKGRAAGMALGPDIGAGDWPAYRHDPARSGGTAAAVSADLAPLWATQVFDRLRPEESASSDADSSEPRHLRMPTPRGGQAGAALSAPTVADGTVYVAAVDAHRVVALAAADGTKRWDYTAGGRVDTPPTIYRGLCLFGSADGWAYCLRASDGALVWRFRAAPAERRIVVRGQVESAWPVSGGVLVAGDLACFAAGRHGQADGGIRVYAVEAATGALVWRGRIRHGQVLNLLTSDGRALGVGKRTAFDLKTGESTIPPRGVPRGDYDANLLDPVFINRIFIGNDAVSGQWVAANADWAAAVAAFRSYGYHARYEWNVPGRGDWKITGKRTRGQEKGWSVQVPVQVQALIVAGETVCVAGAPEPIDPRITEAVSDKGTDLRRVNQILAETPDLVDPKGGEVWVLSAADGAKLGSLKVAAAPVFDGLAAAGGRLYFSAQDGSVRCFGTTK